VCTIRLDGSSSRGRWETFTSSGASLSSSYSTGATRGFKGVVTSSVMTNFHLHQQKTKKVAETMWYLHLKRVEAFYFTN